MSRPLTPPPLGGGPPPVSVFGHQCPDNVSGHVRRAWEAQHSGGGMTHVCVAVGPARPSARFLGQWEQSGQIRSLTMTELYFTVWRPEVSGQRVGRAATAEAWEGPPSPVLPWRSLCSSTFLNITVAHRPVCLHSHTGAVSLGESVQFSHRGSSYWTSSYLVHTCKDPCSK